MIEVRRREFVGLAFAAVFAASRAARAEQPMKRVGILMGANEADSEYQARLKAFRQQLASLGWIEEKNIHIDVRWGVGDVEIKRGAAELVALSPDVLLANATPSALALKRETGTIPIVFAAVTDPVLVGLVETLAHPGGNVTGFTSAEVALSGKWLQLLKEIAPDVGRVAIFAPANNIGAQAQIGAIQAVAAPMSVELSRIVVGSAGEMEKGLSAFASGANGGLIVSRTVESYSARAVIVALAAKYRLPAIYPDRVFVTSGGLVAYGPDIINDYRKAADYVDRILKGERPANLPVQVPTKYELALNLKAAKALGVKIPANLLASADELIE
jgi:putative ABC transport system substrate-binding protein